MAHGKKRTHVQRMLKCVQILAKLSIYDASEIVNKTHLSACVPRSIPADFQSDGTLHLLVAYFQTSTMLQQQLETGNKIKLQKICQRARIRQFECHPLIVMMQQH